jgi:hypothetical protein
LSTTKVVEISAMITQGGVLLSVVVVGCVVIDNDIITTNAIISRDLL